MRKARRVLTRPAVVVLAAGVGAISLAGVALAVAPVHGAVYKGSSGECAASIRKQCVFVFRVSSDGKTLRFVKSGQAITIWSCPGGGGEAIFGSGTHQYKVPTAAIASDGSFSGSDGHGNQKVVMTGRFTGTGTTAVLKFVAPSGVLNHRCHTPQLSLKKK